MRLLTDEDDLIIVVVGLLIESNINTSSFVRKWEGWGVLVGEGVERKRWLVDGGVAMKRIPIVVGVCGVEVWSFHKLWWF